MAVLLIDSMPNPLAGYYGYGLAVGVPFGTLIAILAVGVGLAIRGLVRRIGAGAYVPAAIVNWSRVRKTAALSVVVLVTLAATGCANVNTEAPGSEIDDLVVGELSSQETRGNATIDFGTQLPGEWQQLIIVCKGATEASVESALGFSWPEGPNTRNSGFLAMLVFSDGSRVEKYLSVGQNDFYQDLYFTPCSTPEDSGDADFPTPIVLPRRSSELTFHFSSKLEYWYVKLTDLEALAARAT